MREWFYDNLKQLELSSQFSVSLNKSKLKY